MIIKKKVEIDITLTGIMKLFFVRIFNKPVVEINLSVPDDLSNSEVKILLTKSKDVYMNSEYDTIAYCFHEN